MFFFNYYVLVRAIVHGTRHIQVPLFLICFKLWFQVTVYARLAVQRLSRRTVTIMRMDTCAFWLEIEQQYYVYEEHIHMPVISTK